MLSLEQQNAWRERYRASHPGWQPATELYAALVRAQLPPDGRLLDLGCGRGGLVEQLDHPLPLLVGVDPDWQSLAAHRLALSRVAAASERLPFAPASFDVVIASWVLEHLAQPAHTFRTVQRVLKPGGVLIFITPNGRHPLTLLNRAIGRLGRVQDRLVTRLYGRAGGDTFPTWYRANDAHTLQTAAAAAGLRLATLHTIPDPTYLAFTPALFRLMSWFEDSLPPARHLHLVGCLQRPDAPEDL